MAKCDYCGSTILLGGIRDGGMRFCNQKCHQNRVLMSLAQNVPVDILETKVNEVHQGPCPHCSGSGPVDVHTSYFIWSALILTSWSSRPRISCRSCGVKAKLGNGFASLVLGWWGFPWGIVLTPIQVGRNFVGIFQKPDPSRPSQLLHRLVCLSIASQFSRMPAATTPPPLPPGISN